MRRYGSKKYYRRWLAISLIAAMLSLAIAPTYFYCVNKWSVNYYGDRLVIGRSLYPEVFAKQPAIAKKLNRIHVDDEILVKAFAGETKSIWPKNEITQRYFYLVFIYTFEIVLVAFFIISVLHAIECYEIKRK